MQLWLVMSISSSIIQMTGELQSWRQVTAVMQHYRELLKASCSVELCIGKVLALCHCMLLWPFMQHRVSLRCRL